MFSGASILLLIALLIIVGTIAGQFANRFRLPALTGQILVGILLGESFSHLVPDTQQQAFDPFITFAVSLVAVAIGGHLEFRRLHNALRRIVVITICQVSLTFIIVLLVFQWLNPFGLQPPHTLCVHLIMASIATSTSPVSTLHIIREKKARGLLVKTAIAVIAVNNLLTIVIFAICRAISADILFTNVTLAQSLVPSVLAVLTSLFIGCASGYVLIAYCKRMNHHEKTYRQGAWFTGLLVSISLAAGLCEFITEQFGYLHLHASPILANMMIGVVLANRSSFKDELLSVFQMIEAAIFTLFFVLAGSHFRFETVQHVLAATGLFVVLRVVAKNLGGFVGGYLSRSTPKMSRHIGSMLTAQGAIAIALVIIIEQDPLLAQFKEFMTACVLAAVVIFELASGPVISYTLNRSGESGQDRTRLIEFLQEEFILPSVYAKDKWSVLEEMCYFMRRAHQIDTPVAELLRIVREREEEITTALGQGLAVPHARIKEGDRIFGVLALLDPPIDFDAPDGEPVRLVVMIATPHNLAYKHLQVIAAITRMMKNDNIRNALFSARTAEEIHEIIESEEAETFNYFVEE